MKSGLYALASLDNAPIAAADCACLAVSAPGAAPQPWAVRALDGDVGRACHVDQAGPVTTVLLGYLDEPDDLAAALGLSRETPAAVLAGAAFARYGDAAPSHMLGEWSFVRWDAVERSLVLMASETCRDPIFYALSGTKVAVAPDLRALSNLSWIGRKLDPEGLLLHMARAPLRRGLTTETIVAGVHKVVEGTVVRISADRLIASTPCPLPTPQRWRGSFRDAVAELEAVLLRAVSQTLARHRQPACLLSGGLDSSVLGYLASRALPPEGEMAFVTSAAGSDSGVTDETAYAALVADRLGFPMIRVVPPQEPGVLRPSIRWMAQATSPAATPAHYLYEAMYDAAASGGADVLFDGVIGEATISAIDEPDTLQNELRRFARATKRRVLNRSAEVAHSTDGPDEPFHTVIAPGLRRLLPPRIAELASQPAGGSSRPERRPASDLFGYAGAVLKSASTPTSAIDQSLRVAMPFRDRRLVTLFAGMPMRFIEQNGMSRAPARAILKGHVPDAIRLRIAGMPFAPDYDGRILNGARAAHARIALFRAAELGQWLDLDWLDAALYDMTRSKAGTLDHRFKVALTAIAAEYLLWWQTT